MIGAADLHPAAAPIHRHPVPDTIDASVGQHLCRAVDLRRRADILPAVGGLSVVAPITVAVDVAQHRHAVGVVGVGGPAPRHAVFPGGELLVILGVGVVHQPFHVAVAGEIHRLRLIGINAELIQKDLISAAGIRRHLHRHIAPAHLPVQRKHHAPHSAAPGECLRVLQIRPAAQNGLRRKQLVHRVRYRQRSLPQHTGDGLRVHIAQQHPFQRRTLSQIHHDAGHGVLIRFIRRRPVMVGGVDGDVAFAAAPGHAGQLPIGQPDAGGGVVGSTHPAGVCRITVPPGIGCRCIDIPEHGSGIHIGLFRQGGGSQVDPLQIRPIRRPGEIYRRIRVGRRLRRQRRIDRLGHRRQHRLAGMQQHIQLDVTAAEVRLPPIGIVICLGDRIQVDERAAILVRQLPLQLRHRRQIRLAVGAVGIGSGQNIDLHLRVLLPQSVQQRLILRLEPVGTLRPVGAYIVGAQHNQSHIRRLQPVFLCMSAGVGQPRGASVSVHHAGAADALIPHIVASPQQITQYLGIGVAHLIAGAVRTGRISEGDAVADAQHGGAAPRQHRPGQSGGGHSPQQQRQRQQHGHYAFRQGRYLLTALQRPTHPAHCVR